VGAALVIFELLRGNLQMTFVYMTGAIIVGISLFWVRCRNSALYGLVEVLFGLLVIHFSTHPAYTVLAADNVNYTEVFLAKWAGILAAIYIFARGLDNIDKGPLPAGLRTVWDGFFHRKAPVFRRSASS
jgi:hypothetical protein